MKHGRSHKQLASRCTGRLRNRIHSSGILAEIGDRMDLVIILLIVGLGLACFLLGDLFARWTGR